MSGIVSLGYVKAISTGQFFSGKANGPLPTMQTVHETRRQRLGMLKQKYRYWASLNEALGWEKTNTRLSQIHKGTLRSDRGVPFVLGDDTAREIERTLELPEGWMDTPPTYAELSGGTDAMSKMQELMAVMEPEMQYQAVRLVGALPQPGGANGTTGKNH